MTRGTTPTLKFALPIPVNTLSECWATISQNGTDIINKSLSEMTADGNNLSVKLTQSETLSLSEDYIADIQLRVRTNDGSAFASKQFRVRVAGVLRDGEI